jgi:hypothetical protein
MRSVVIDTNVFVVANGDSHADQDCIITCIDELEKVRGKKIISIDSNGLCFSEYFEHVNRSGQPGPGDAFVKWLWDNQANQDCCESVAITPVDDGRIFDEFPNDPELTAFDRSDRKFVAVARNSQYQAKIINATDSDWWEVRIHFAKHQIDIEFLCPELFS